MFHLMTETKFRAHNLAKRPCNCDQFSSLTIFTIISALVYKLVISYDGFYWHFEVSGITSFNYTILRAWPTSLRWRNFYWIIFWWTCRDMYQRTEINYIFINNCQSSRTLSSSKLADMYIQLSLRKDGLQLDQTALLLPLIADTVEGEESNAAQPSRLPKC